MSHHEQSPRRLEKADIYSLVPRLDLAGDCICNMRDCKLQAASKLVRYGHSGNSLDARTACQLREEC